MKSGDLIIWQGEKPYRDMGNTYTMPWYRRVTLIWTDERSYLIELPDGSREAVERQHLLTDEEYKTYYAANKDRGWVQWLIMPLSRTVDGITLV